MTVGSPGSQGRTCDIDGSAGDKSRAEAKFFCAGLHPERDWDDRAEEVVVPAVAGAETDCQASRIALVLIFARELIVEHKPPQLRHSATNSSLVRFRPVRYALDTRFRSLLRSDGEPRPCLTTLPIMLIPNTAASLPATGTPTTG